MAFLVKVRRSILFFAVVLPFSLILLLATRWRWLTSAHPYSLPQIRLRGLECRKSKDEFCYASGVMNALPLV